MSMIYRPITITCTKDNLKREKISMYEHGAVSFMFTCLNGNQQIDLSECTGASYIGTKPDGHLVGISCEIKDGKVILPISLQMTTAPGILQGVVVLYSESGNVRFNGVNFEVLECPDEADIESTDEFTVLEDMIDEVHKLIDEGIEASQGKSAYEIARDNGFEGTEAEWLESLKGTDGKDAEITVDQWYNDESTNAVSAKALAPEFNRKLSTGYIYNTADIYGLWLICGYASNPETADPYAKTMYFTYVENDIRDSDGEIIPSGYYLVTGSPKYGICALWSFTDNTLYRLERLSGTSDFRITSSKDISDINNYYTDKTIDGAFAEIGKQLKNINSDAYKKEIADIIKNEYEAELLDILGGDEDVTE